MPGVSTAMTGFQVDAEVPTFVKPFDVNAQRFSLQSGYNDLQVSFEVDEALAVLEVTLGELQLDCGDFQNQTEVICSHTFTNYSTYRPLNIIW